MVCLTQIREDCSECTLLDVSRCNVLIYAWSKQVNHDDLPLSCHPFSSEFIDSESPHHKITFIFANEVLLEFKLGTCMDRGYKHYFTSAWICGWVVH